MKRLTLIFAALAVITLGSCTKYGNCVVCQGSIAGTSVVETFCESNKDNKDFADGFVKVFGGTCK